MYNRPRQLERLRKEHYDKVYARQPQLLKRLISLISESEIIERRTEPIAIQVKKLGKNNLNGKKLGNKRRKELRLTRARKISEVRPDVLWNLR